MSYQVIARKWRPQSFDEVSGQGHVTRALANAIQSGRIPHAILFTGPRGVGKTTLARLVARCLNCEKGPTAQPCGVCPACVEITESRSTDVQEMDAASRTGVDDVRDIIESIRYAAAPGKHRIFIVDEVHMLSTNAFNALLKTLEEPPPRSLFIFATTNPEKIPFTVLSRCQRHDLRRIPLATVSERLAEICRAEGIEISAKSLAAVAREGEGSMRDAQTLLDQIVAYGGQRVADEVVAEILDLVDHNVMRAIVEACLANDPRAALEQAAVATAGGAEPSRIAEALLEILRDLTVLQLAPDAEGVFEGTDEERGELAAMAARCEPARLRRMFRALVREIEDLEFAPQPRAVLEMALIRLATMPAGDDVEKLLARLDALERRLAAGERPATGGGASSPAVGRPAPGPAGPPGPAREQAERGTTGGPPSRGASLPKGAPPAKSTPARGASLAKTATGSSGRGGRTAEVRPELQDLPEEPDDFDGPPATGAPSASVPGEPELADAIDAPGEELFDELDGGPEAVLRGRRGHDASVQPGAVFDRLRSRALELDRARFASLEQTRCVSLEAGRMKLVAATSFHVERLGPRLAELEILAKELLGRSLRIEVELSSARREADESAESRERSRRQRQEALNSESVNLAIELLGAEIVEIRPLGEKR